MGSWIGHVAPGAGFLVIGLWHLFNHIKLHSLNPNGYIAPVWFPCHAIKHLELLLIILGTLASISMELIIGPAKHQPFDEDGTIPSYHLHNFEHANISLGLLIYAIFTLIFDKTRPVIRNRDALSLILAGVAFAQQFLLFHLHSTDHMGVEGQFHWLLQTVIVVTLLTTLLGIAKPRSFLVAFVRSWSIAFQGVWFIVMGYMLWTPSLIPKGCFLNLEDGHEVVRCRSGEELDRAKSLVNLQFSWYMTGMTVFVMVFYLLVTRIYPEEPQYLPLVKDNDEELEADHKHQLKAMELER